MFPIASAIASTTTATLSFSNIPQNYTHLQFRVFAHQYAASGSGIGAMYLPSINGNALTKNHQLYGTGTAAASSSDANIPVAYAYYSQTSQYWMSAIIDILDYTDTNKNKTIKSISGWDGNGSGYVGMMSNLYSFNTAAVSSIIFSMGGGSFLAGSRIDLYGLQTSSVTGA